VAPMPPIRRRFLEFVIAVGVLHIAAIALYYALGVNRASVTEQRVFAWTWMGATVLVVFAGLQRLKRARGGRPRA
jgi:hypothetical protein